MSIRDRVVELVRVPARSLVPHPKNWRRHPPAQQAALRGVLAEVGCATAALAYRLPDGRLQLIDGHLRTETLADQVIPVLVLDVSAAEAEQLLVTLDPLAGLAETDPTALAELLDRIETSQPAVQQLLQDLAQQAGTAADAPVLPPEDLEIPPTFQLLIDCRHEDEQRELFTRLEREGYTCRVMTL